MTSHGLHLVSIHSSRSSSGSDGEAIGLVGLRVEVAVEGLVDARLVCRSRNADHVAVAAGGRHGSLPSEGTRGTRVGGVGPHSQTVDVGARSRQLVVHSSRQDSGSSTVAVALGEVEDVSGRSTASSSDGSFVGVDETLRILGGLDGRSDGGDKGVELHSVLTARIREVQFHSKHVVRALSLTSRADHSVVLVSIVSTSRTSASSHSTLTHVVAEDLNTIHVSNDTIAVIEASLVSSHARDASELLAEILRARSRSRDAAQRDLLPIAIREVDGEPVGSDGGSGGEHLPLLVLHDGVVERKREQLVSLLRHVVLEEDVAVDTSNARPSTRRPRITRRAVTVVEVDGILVVGSGGQAVLVRSLLVARKCGARHQFSSPIQNLIGLLSSPTHTLLGNGHIDLSLLANQSAQCSRHYGLDPSSIKYAA